jgi:diketogulonate reductase-like aldo/keto reductase
MQYKELGSTGIQLPEIALGTWKYGGGIKPLQTGIESGAFFIDTAESYGSESVVGEAVKGIRDRVFIASKVSPGRLRRADVLRAADQSLLRLKMDYVDLYQLHGPNPTIPIQETMGAMEDLVDAGKIRFVGVSNFMPHDLKNAVAAMQRHKIVSNQVRYSLIERTIESELLPYCQQNRITILAFSPLGSGLENLRRNDPGGVLTKVAVATGKTEAQVALNWCTAKDGVIALTKSNSPARVVEACEASSWRLSPEHLRMLDEGIMFNQRGTIEIALRRMTRRIYAWTGRLR